MVKDMSKPINVRQAYIAKLLQKLVKNNLISSSRGPKGGFYLNEENRNESIMSIIEVIDGEHKMTNCLLGVNECNEAKPCPLHNIASSAKSELINSFRNNSIGDLAKEIKHGNE
jgi:Rrf2 family protein